MNIEAYRWSRMGMAGTTAWAGAKEAFSSDWMYLVNPIVTGVVDLVGGREWRTEELSESAARDQQQVDQAERVDADMMFGALADQSRDTYLAVAALNGLAPGATFEDVSDWLGDT